MRSIILFFIIKSITMNPQNQIVRSINYKTNTIGTKEIKMRREVSLYVTGKVGADGTSKSVVTTQKLAKSPLKSYAKVALEDNIIFNLKGENGKKLKETDFLSRNDMKTKSSILPEIHMTNTKNWRIASMKSALH